MDINGFDDISPDLITAARQTLVIGKAVPWCVSVPPRTACPVCRLRIPGGGLHSSPRHARCRIVS